MPARPQALAYADVHRQSQAEAHRVAGALTDEQFNWSPESGGWSVGECLAHLNVVADAYLPLLESATADGAPRAEGPFEYGFLARKVAGAVQPDGPALRTGAALDPSRRDRRAPLDRDRTLAAFDGHAGRYVAACERADGLDLARIKVRYPFMRLLRLPLGAVLGLTGQHALRHLAQARRVASAPGFPA